jgi:hypothetical protein
VNRDGWQVYFSGTQGSLIPYFLSVLNLGFDSMQMASSLIPVSKSRKRHSKRSGVFAVLRWSLASQIVWWTAVFSTVPTANYPCRSFPFLRAALFADALAGRLLCLGWPDITPAAGTSLAL